MSGPESALQGSQEKGLPRTRTIPEFPPNPAIDREHVWLGGSSGSGYRTPAQTRRMKERCLRRDGYKCMYCLLPVQSVVELTIHHVDHKIYNQWSDNIQLFHPDCNWDERWGHPPRRLQPTTLSSAPPTPKKEGAEHLLPETRAKLDDRTTTTSQLTNLENEVKYRKACFQGALDMDDQSITDPEKFMNKRQLMSYAMEKSGASQDAAYGYNRRLFAPRVGPLREISELGGMTKTVGFRDPKDYRLSIDQLMDKYPKEGQDYSH